MTLRLETDAPDQPVIEVPVYGLILDALAADPPVVILEPDDTPAGTVRRLRLITYPGQTLVVASHTSDLEMVQVRPTTSASTRQRHIRYFDVRLVSPTPAGTHNGTLTFETNVPGLERFEIPVRVRQPD